MSALERHRQAVLPDLVSYASMDAVLAIAESSASAPEILQRFREQHEGRDDNSSRARVLYLEGRRLQMTGEHREAVTKFSEVIVRDDQLPEPFLRLAECLAASDEMARAEKTLRDALGRKNMQYADPWKLWAKLALVDLGRAAEEALASFPALDAESEEEPGSSYGADLRWVLERVASAEPVRINCGGGRYVDANGVIWERDRFFTSRSGPFPGRAISESKSKDDRLYQSWRWFFSRNLKSAAGYSIPLPSGNYEVTLDFAEVFWRDKERDPKREFDVVIEEKTARAAANHRSFTTTVDDGFLDIGVGRRRGDPKIAAIAIRRLE